MAQFIDGFQASFLLARVIPALLMGLLCGYAVARTHLITATPIPPFLVGCLAALLLVGLQIATWWVPGTVSSAVVYHSLGSHAAYVVMSLVMATTCGVGASWAQRGWVDGSTGSAKA